MTDPDPHTSLWRRVLRAGPSAACFVLFALVVWLVVEPTLLYHYQCPVFMTGGEFLQRFTARPGGLAEYAALFLAQWYDVPWLGILVVTGLAWLVCMTTRSLLNATGRRVHPAASLVPAVLLLAMCQRYSDHLITPVALAVSLSAAALYVRLRVRRASVRLGVVAAIAAALFYAVGGMVVLFGVLCGLFELLHRRKVAAAVACVVIATALPICFAWYSYEFGVAETLKPLVPFRRLTLSFSGFLTLPSADRWGPLEWSGGLHTALMLFFPLALAGSLERRRLVALWRRLRRRDAVAATEQGPPRWSVLSLAVFLFVASVLLWASFDGDRKGRILVDFYGANDDWPEVLAHACTLGRGRANRFVMHEVNRALYHTDQLPEAMFHWPQRLEADSLLLANLESQQSFATYPKAGAIFLELGQVNYAEKWTQMALEAMGERPAVVKRLVRIYLLQRRPSVARTLLHRLARNPRQRAWARDALTRLDADPSGEWDDVVRRVREVMPGDDQLAREPPPGKPILPEQILIGLLDVKGGQGNRMAFEYLMTLHLLSRRPESVIRGVALMNRFEAYRYRAIPRHYAEAVLTFLSDPAHRDDAYLSDARNLQRVQTAEKWAAVTSRRTQAQLVNFKELLHAYNNATDDDRKKAFNELLDETGGTYFFYHTFGFSFAETPSTPTDVVTEASP